MSWQRIRNPNQIVQVGQTIPLAIIAVDATGRRMTFSIKQAEPDPWADAAAKYGKHSIHEGKILRTAEFGAFIELEPNVEGLAHISELSDKRVNKVEEAVKVGDTVKVRVLDVDVPQRRMSLSLKKTDGSFAPPPPPPPPKPPKIRKTPLRGGLDF
jgi:4-hydroxy-3-methylbut-2-enyl diphosphate reductase